MDFPSRFQVFPFSHFRWVRARSKGTRYHALGSAGASTLPRNLAHSPTSPALRSRGDLAFELIELA